MSDLDYVNYTNIGEPSSYEEVMATSDANIWLQAMRSEMDSIKENNTWELVKLPAGRKSLPWKWAFRYKYVKCLFLKPISFFLGMMLLLLPVTCFYINPYLS